MFNKPFIVDFCASVMLVTFVLLGGVTTVFVNALLLVWAYEWIKGLM